MSEPSHDQVLQFVRRQDCPFVTTREVAERFDTVTRRTINKRLNDLHDDTELQKREIGARSIVWYLPDQPESDSTAFPSSDSQ
jgi:DeoR/GlpR family transcriptional regulator of sugar metabolism